MKTLKFEHEIASLVAAGKKTSTWRIHDDKDLAVNDEVRLVDKVEPTRPETWRVFGSARIDRIIEKRLGDITEEDMDGHEKFTSQQEMLHTYQKYFNNDVTLSTPIKLIYFTFISPQQITNKIITTTSGESVIIYADGGSRGNPGPSASGFMIMELNTKEVLVDKGVYLGVTTNNQAEYLALKYALEEAKKMGAQRLEIFMDSMLVVNQLKGIFKVKNRDLWPIHQAIKQLLSEFKEYTISHVPREQNSLADAAVNRAMDEGLGM